jgi:hypothetical protein
MSIRRDRSKGNAARRTVIAVGALGAATAGFRRWRHRNHSDQPEH